MSCGGVRDYLPQKEALDEGGVRRHLAGTNASVDQAGTAEDVPVPPLQFFAVHYPVDLVVETRHPHWSMHEYAEVEVGGRTVWIAKDSGPDGVQTVSADLPDLQSWLAEVPVPRRRAPVKVKEAMLSNGEREWTLSYDNPAGVHTTVRVRGTPRQKLELRRNSSTFDHSGQAVSALLDLRRRQTRLDASVRYGSDAAKLRRVLGLVPVKGLLEQLQAGLAAASMGVRAQGSSLQVERPFPGQAWPTRSKEQWSWDGEAGTGWLQYQAHGTAHSLRFESGGLAEARLRVDGVAEPAMEFRMSAPLPDVTRPFAGPVHRNFVLWVGGQAQGYGELSATWQQNACRVMVKPKSPRWFAQRPVQSRVMATDSGYRVESRIVDPQTGDARAVVP